MPVKTKLPKPHDHRKRQISYRLNPRMHYFLHVNWNKYYEEGYVCTLMDALEMRMDDEGLLTPYDSEEAAVVEANYDEYKRKHLRSNLPPELRMRKTKLKERMFERDIMDQERLDEYGFKKRNLKGMKKREGGEE